MNLLNLISRLGAWRRWTAAATRTIAALGFVLTANAAHAQGTIRDTEIEEILREWSDPIFEAAGLVPEDVQIYIVNDNSMNAFVTAGQRMFLHTGLILRAEAPNELIGVIAHETGHISRGDWIRMDEAFSRASRPMLLTMGLGVAAIAAGCPDCGLAILSSGQQIAYAEVFKHTRGAESGADIAAAQFLDATGQSGQGLLAFFSRFRQDETLSDSFHDPYFRTHPLPRDRMSTLESRLRTSPYWDVKDSPEEQHRLDMMKAKIHGFLKPSGETLNQYCPKDPAGQPQCGSDQPSRYALAVAFHQNAEVNKARELIEGLIAEEPDNPYFQELMGQILFESGLIAESVPFHERALELKPYAPLLEVNLAHALLEMNDPSKLERAERLLVGALAKEPELPTAWYLRSTLHAKRGQTGMALWASAYQHVSTGRLMEARSFAARAMGQLEPGSLPFEQSCTLYLSVEAQMREQARGRAQESGFLGEARCLDVAAKTRPAGGSALREL